MTLDELQTAVKDRIEADPWIAAKGVGVVSAIKGDVDSKVAQIVAKLGICVIVEPAQLSLRYANNAVSYDGDLLNLFIFENVLINRGATGSGVTATDVGAKLIHLFKPSSNPPAALVPVNCQPWDTTGKALVYLVRMIGNLPVTEPTLPEEP